jgi:predicted DNA-binding transcriptional regulator AlpA
MVLKDRCVTVEEMLVQLGIGEASVYRTLEELRLKKVCAR